MTTHTTSVASVAAALLLGVALTGCSRTPQPEPVPPPPPSPANAAAPAPANAEMPPDATAPAQPAPDAPPPQEPSPVPKPTSNEPALEAMKPALASASKMGVSVDLLYQLDAAAAGEPLTLHLAAVPQIEGTSLKLSVKNVAGIGLAPGAVTMQKSGASAVYRQRYSITRGASAPAALRVLVTTDSPSGSAFGYFTVPLDGGISAQIQRDSVKQR
jgi:hypothetical protein